MTNVFSVTFAFNIVAICVNLVSSTGVFVNQGNLGPFAYTNVKSTQIHNFKTVVVFFVIQICLASKEQQQENVAQKWTW